MDKLLCILVHKDVDSGIDECLLQGRAAHPLVLEVGETLLVVRQQRALITLSAQRKMKGPTL